MPLNNDRKAPKHGFGMLLAAIAAGLLIATWLPATTGTTTAERTLGQGGFAASLAGAGADGLSGPLSVALDSSVTPGHLYVADTKNNRVLGYRDASGFLNGAPADLVIGQENFCSTECNAGGAPGGATLCSPSAVAVDSSGNVYVADSGNNRALEYNDPFSALTEDGQSAGFVAGRVFGQNGFAATQCNQGDAGAPTNQSLCDPRGIAIDNDDALWIADAGNNRVLSYARPLADNAASLVVGQPDFSSFKCNQGATPGAFNLCAPAGVAIDSSGNLYVADQNNNRVLEYDAPRSDGPAAHLVFGQPGLTSNAAGGCAGASASADGLCFPAGVAVDGDDNLFVADAGNNRVLEYDKPLASGAGTSGTPGSAADTTADLVFGHHGSFTASGPNDGGLSADSLSSPTGVVISDAGNVYIADTGNNRVLAYNGASIPASTITPASSPSATPQASPCPGSGEGSAPSADQEKFAPQAAPTVKVSSGKLGFGRAVFFASTGGATVNKVITLTNTTTTDISDMLAIDPASVDGSDFTAVDNATAKECNGTIPAKKSCKITVSFAPTDTGKRTAILDIEDASTGNTDATVKLAGTSFAGALKFSTKSLTFPKTANGASSKPKNVKVTSTYKIPSTISSISVFDTDGVTPNGEYTVVPAANCATMTVMAKGPCTLTVTFDPFTGAGKDNAEIQVADDAAKSPQIIKLAAKAFGSPVATPTPTPTGISTATPTPATTCTSDADCTDTGTTCQSGTCACSDPTLTDCGGFTGCTDTTSDPNNCDFCGNSCDGEACVASTCTAATSCNTDADCTDPNTNCQDGTCACIISGQTDCGPSTGCVDLTSNPNDCDVCGASCDGEECSFSACSATPTPPTCNTNTDCTDTGTTCQSGSCLCSASGETDCSGCTDTTSDSNNCGECGNVCPSGAFCSSSACVPGAAGPTPTSSGGPVLAPSMIEEFGIQIGNTASEVLTLSNDQQVVLNISAITITVVAPLGATPEWTETDNCGINDPTGLSSPALNPLQTCMITVTFTPAVGGVQEDSISVQSDFTGLAPAVELYGSSPSTPTPTSSSTSGNQPGAPSPPQIVPSSINFGSITVGGASSAIAVTVTNRSSSELVFNATPADAPAIAGAAVTGQFAIVADACSGMTIPSLGTCVVTVQFTPLSTGVQVGALTFGDNATGSLISPQAVELRGSGIFGTPAPTPAAPGQQPPVPQIAPSSINFGTVAVGGTSSTESVKVTNSSQIPLVMGTSTISGPFAIASDGCSGMTVVPESSCVVGLTYNPTAAGPQTGSLVFSDNAATVPLQTQSVTLQGQGSLSSATPTPANSGGEQPPPPTLSASSINFGQVALGGTSAPSTVTVKNTSGDALVMSGTTVSGPFSVASDGCSGTTVLAEGQCSITIVYTPTATIPQTGSVTFIDNASTSPITKPQTVALQGVGTTSTPAPTAVPGGQQPSAPTLSASTLNFGTVAVGATSSSMSVTVTATSQNPLVMGSSTTAAPFAIVNDGCAGVSLTVPSHCIIMVDLTPTAAGTQTGVLDIVDNVPTSALSPAQSVVLEGFGSATAPPPTPAPGTGSLPPPPVIGPSTLTFGTLSVGVTSAAQTVKVTNNSSIPLVMATTDATVTGQFVLATDGCSGLTLQAQGSCSVSVAFAPQSAGDLSGLLSFSDNAQSTPTNPQNVQLRGVGSNSTPAPTAEPPGQAPTAPVIVPNSYNFGAIPLGAASAPTSVKLTNSSASLPLTVSAINITSQAGSAVAAQFTETDDCLAAPLGPSAFCTVDITFTPTIAAPEEAILTFVTNAQTGVSPSSVTMNGAGSSPATATAAPAATPTSSFLGGF
jgi:sugar lactone lactonase YvrE